ncbi:carboxypeptidase-like regulatory domain-containing protein [Imperialibacter roseus]|uniref:Carboxypeptidase-like regulatory domain-containing protein n=1 Tax=Imperialibacter roseus TaxID=1324217 RepID=A0ABZ0IP33_9BACT|nr:carboxypeptidase-like regulatory domain-containing protein [Imperialibacter roseus]WOK05481.1 carboxypeptidase-like regulatory domain-containing protein [Imperialibacter roseus]|tara:strand:+ start:26689 stop:27294 length:606 start_codon:yes stop_codon:yes gene_type:complete
MKKLLVLLLLTIGIVLGSFAQQPATLQITGSLLDKESLDPLPFATVLVKGSFHGTITSSQGLFTLLVHPTDTVQFSMVGYKTSELIIPAGMKENRYALLELMEKSTVVLKELKVYPWPSASQFHSAFLGVTLPPTEQDKTDMMQKELEATMRNSYESEKYYDEQLRNRQIYQLTGQIPPNHFLDPVRWLDFIEELRAKNKK